RRVHRRLHYFEYHRHPVLDHGLSRAGLERSGARSAEAICVCVGHRAGRLLLWNAYYRGNPGCWASHDASSGRGFRVDLRLHAVYHPDVCIDEMADLSTQSVLRFEHISVSFGDAVALNDVSFDLRAGGTRIIYGAAGSGKSVALKIALGLLKPDSGRVFVFDKDTTDLKEKDLFPIRSKMGVLFQ